MVDVIKISGAQLDDPDFLAQFVQIIKERVTPTVIVHGGGKEISQLQSAFGITPKKIDGLRVSDEESLKLVQMVLCGAVNPRIVTALQLAGVTAQGLSGVDQGLVTAQKLHHPKGDLGRVGEVVTVQPDILQRLLAASITPVIAPICIGEDGVYNVNADHVAGAIGVALNAERVIFLTDVVGVLNNGALQPHLTQSQVEILIESGVITDGMIPKVETALYVASLGAKQVTITNLDGLRQQSGTILTTS